MKVKKWILPSLVILGLAIPLALPLLVGAQVTTPGMQEGLLGFTTGAGITGETSLPLIIGRIVRIVISLLGLVATVIVIIGGFKWMTSGGSEEKIADAKKLMINGLIGLVLVILAYAIATFIISQLGGITQE